MSITNQNTQTSERDMNVCRKYAGERFGFIIKLLTDYCIFRHYDV